FSSLMHTKHDGSGLVYPMSDTVNVSGFKSRTSHFFMLDFRNLSTNLSTNQHFLSTLARTFVYKGLVPLKCLDII
ncbi:MAG: hypothetical protein ACJ71F_11690, partial [Nitrososphaeraceae archaeon]